MNDLLLDVRAQPEVLQRALDQLLREIGALSSWAEKLRRRELDQIVLTGMGGSYAALFPTHVKLTKSGIRSWAVETSELLYDYRELLTERTLLIAVSQSGRSVELVRLLEEL
ncbi:MAG: SIS domain-containing protein, partial [Aggregatilineales bacterium]